MTAPAPAPAPAAPVDTSAAARYGLTASVSHLLQHTPYAHYNYNATARQPPTQPQPQAQARNNPRHAGAGSAASPRAGDSEASLQQLFPAVALHVPTGRSQRSFLLDRPDANTRILPDRAAPAPAPAPHADTLVLPAVRRAVSASPRMLELYDEYLTQQQRGHSALHSRTQVLQPPNFADFPE
jgi:hypothetical protein